MNQISGLHNAQLLALNADANLAQSDQQKGCVGRQLVMFKGESSKSGEVAQNLSKKKKKRMEKVAQNLKFILNINLRQL